MKVSKQVGVILFQLGGPDSLDAIEPFLYNLFCDPDIIDFPFAKLARQPLARLISSTRAKKVRNHYAEIGGRSPILELTRLQASALEKALASAVDAKVFVAMRYWHPLTEETVAELAKHRFEQLVLLPLYPQYSRTTTGSSLNEWNRRFTSNHVPVKIIRSFYDFGPYVHAVVAQVTRTLRRFGDTSGVHLVFSAHSVPVRVIEGGDPYQEQIEATVRNVMARGGWASPHTLCYQSKVGADKWLQPSLHDTIDKLAGEGEKKLLVVPIAFVSDHVETLGEINHEAREQAERLGIEQFELMPGLNDAPEFIEALAGLVLSALGYDGSQRVWQGESKR
ncbi:MAG: ferrochelatase [Acidobacteria bacterium]|nr:ferrochelatase [Acidobacteriota bacterium]